jgi:hypothetical protein
MIHHSVAGFSESTSCGRVEPAGAGTADTRIMGGGTEKWTSREVELNLMDHLQA